MIRGKKPKQLPSPPPKPKKPQTRTQKAPELRLKPGMNWENIFIHRNPHSVLSQDDFQSGLY